MFKYHSLVCAAPSILEKKLVVAGKQRSAPSDALGCLLGAPQCRRRTDERSVLVGSCSQAR